MDLLKSLRIADPLLFFFIFWLFLSIFFLLGGRYGNQQLLIPKKLLERFPRLPEAGLILLIANYVVLVGAYICSSVFYDQAEANVAAVSWLVETGHDLFPPIDSAERYINNYGPVLYLTNGFFLHLFGPSFFSVKLGCGLAAMLSIVCMFYSAASIATRRIALLTCAYATLAFLSITNSFAFHAASFWLRPDPLLIFFVSIGLLGVLKGNRTTATLISAIAFGCSLNLKVNAFVNFIPIYVLLFLRFGLVPTLVASVGAVVTAALPFLIFPQISLGKFLIWISQSRNKPASFIQLFDVTKWVFYISLPLLLSLGYLFSRSRASFYQFIRTHKGFIYALLGCVVASLAFSIKIGVLENNHLPFIPLFAYLLTLVLEWIRVESNTFPVARSQRQIKTIFTGAALAFMITTVLYVALEEARLVSTLIKSPGKEVISDIQGIMQSHPRTTIGMGFSEGGGNYEQTYYRPLLVFAGNPYLVDPVIMFEMQVSGVPTESSKTIDALRSCQTQLWLLPKVTTQPFDLKNFYSPHDLVFTEEFRHTFMQHYQRSGESKFYDLWSCKNATH